MPSLSLTGYLRPESLDGALEATRRGAIPIAGGTAVIVRPPPGTHTLVDLSGVLAADIVETGGAYRIGAMATLGAVAEHRDLGAIYDGALAAMLRLVGSPLLRNVATIGGHLARGRLSDVVPLLIALDASVVLYDGSERTVALEDYYRQELHRVPGLITHVTIPPRPSRSAAAFRKLSRTHFDVAMLNGAARLCLGGDGIVSEARVVVGETPALATRVPAVEEVLHGDHLGPETIAAAAATARTAVAVDSDRRASAEYRTQLVGVVVSRCLADVAARLDEEGG